MKDVTASHSRALVTSLPALWSHACCRVAFSLTLPGCTCSTGVPFFSLDHCLSECLWGIALSWPGWSTGLLPTDSFRDSWGGLFFTTCSWAVVLPVFTAVSLSCTLILSLWEELVYQHCCVYSFSLFSIDFVLIVKIQVLSCFRCQKHLSCQKL